jgi:signal transduction histidine kinase
MKTLLNKPTFSILNTLILGLLLHFSIFSQNNKNELLQKIENTNDSAEKVKLLNQVAIVCLSNNNLLEALEYSQKGQEISLNSKNKEGNALSAHTLGKIYTQNKQYSNALQFFIQSIQIYNKLNLKNELAKVNWDAGKMIQVWGVHEKALTYLLDSYEIKKNISNLEDEEHLLADIGQSYVYTTNYDSALNVYKKLLEVCVSKNNKNSCLYPLRIISKIYDLKGDFQNSLIIKEEIVNIIKSSDNQKDLVSSLNNLGYAYKKVNNQAQASKYFNEALGVNNLSEQNSLDEKATLLTNNGIIQQNLGNYSSSQISFDEALALRKSESNTKEISTINNLITKLNIDIKNFQLAKISNEDAIKVAEQNNHSEELSKGYELQNELYQALGESKKALTAYERFSTIQAQQYAEEVKDKENLLELKTLIEKIEQELVIQLSDQEKKQIEIEKVQLESENKEKELTLLRRERELEQSRLAQEKLAKEKAEQELISAKNQLEADRRKRQIEELQSQQAIKSLEEARKQREIEILTKDKELLEKNNELLAQSEKLKAQQLDEEQAKQRYFYIGLILAALIVALILVGFFIKQRDSKRLAKQNKQLELQQDEINKLLMETNKKNIALQESEEVLRKHSKEVETANNNLQEAQNQLTVAFASEQEKNKKIETLLSEVQEKNDQLQQSEEELKQQAEELASTNENLNQTLEHLKNTQSQLIQSEKMASLGQLIAGVAHEVNTPLGAINASIGAINDALNHSLKMLPKLYHIIENENDRELFNKLIKVSSESVALTSREERTLRKSFVEILENNNIENASDIASNFVDMGIHKDIEEFFPLIKHVEAPFILEAAYHLALQKKNSANIDLAVKKASKVVFALKNYSRQDHTGEAVKTNITENIDTVLTLYHNQLKQGVEVHCFYDEIPEIMGYPDELSQVWTNLITNAIQAMKNKGQIDIYVKNKVDHIEVDIKDYGTGIPENIIHRIFDPFFTTKKAGEGSGLGLDIVKKIVDKHKGNISVESKLNIGSTFTVTLPLKLPIEAKAEDNSNTSSEVPS